MPRHRHRRCKRIASKSRSFAQLLLWNKNTNSQFTMFITKKALLFYSPSHSLVNVSSLEHNSRKWKETKKSVKQNTITLICGYINNMWTLNMYGIWMSLLRILCCWRSFFPSFAVIFFHLLSFVQWKFHKIISREFVT